jgi:N6-L-threonylcarbamoyladenine synthase
MLILGIETSCDETAASVVERGSIVRSNVVASQHDLHEEYAGVVPEIASRAHVERALPVVRRALEDAGVGLGMIDAVAVGHRPGLIGCLLVGVAAAKALAWSLSKPLIAVDHVHAHLYSGLLADTPRPALNHALPALGLVVSGGHTALYHLDSWIDPVRLGGTIDDAVGEAFDKVATILGLPHPGGPNLDRCADLPGANDRAIDLPISRIAPDSLDFSFSGLKTACLYAARGVPHARPGTPASVVHPLTESRVRDIAASFRRAAIAALTLKVRRALDAHPACRTILVGGGVSANALLRREMESLAEARGLRLVLPDMALCMDNAAMIAGLAYPLAQAGRHAPWSLEASPVSALR